MAFPVAEVMSEVRKRIVGQEVMVGRKTIKLAEKRWIAVHKPIGVVTTASDEQGRPNVFSLIPETTGLTYVGRLDVATTGLLLMTTDGEAVHRLTGMPAKILGLLHRPR